MRNSHWLMGLARALAVVGALGVGSTVAWAEDDSDANDKDSRTSQSRDDDESSKRNSRDEDSEKDSESRSSAERDLDREQSNRGDSDASDRSNVRNRDDRSRENRRDQQSRSDRNRSSQQWSEDDRDSRQMARDNERSSNQQQDLGVEFETDDDDRLTVSSIEDNSIAQRARLQEDDVIISVDGRRFSDARQLSRYLQSAGSRRVPIIIERDGNRYTVQLQGARQQYAQSDSQSAAWLGVYLDDNEDGAVITQVYPQGPAARAGLRRGDVVVQFNDEDVTDSEELVEWIEKEEPNSRARFTVLRDDREMQVTATLADRDQFIARTQGQVQGQYQQYSQDRSSQNQYSQDRFNNQNQRYSQRQDHQGRGFQDDDWENQSSRQQDGDFVEYNQPRNDNRGYSSYNYPGRSQQFQDNRQGGDQMQRLERMIRELQEEVRDLRDQVENR